MTVARKPMMQIESIIQTKLEAASRQGQGNSEEEEGRLRGWASAGTQNPGPGQGGPSLDLPCPFGAHR